MRLLVTGANGFVGGHLAEFLAAEHAAVEVFGLGKPFGADPGEHIPRLTMFEIDIDEPAAVGAVVRDVRPDRVIHLAGQSSVHASWTDPGGTLRTNVLGVVHLLDALRALAPPRRVLVVGSADEYGVLPSDSPPVREDAPLRPASPYAVSKAAQGLLALQYDVAGALEVVLTRTFPHTGPRRGELFAESSFARQVAEIEAGRREPVLSVGNLDAVRDFSDVRDVVRAYWALLERGGHGQVYNVCSGRGVRIGEVLDRLIALAGLRVEVRQDPERLRPSDVPVLVGDPGRLQRATGWRPAFTLEQTLGDLLAYWRRRVRGTTPSPA